MPCGIILNRWGRRFTFIAMGIAEVSACILFATGSDFFSFALGNVMYSASAAFASGTDSALLYEFLTATDCWGETAHHELKSWLVSCTALALSAGLGGVMVRQSDTLAYFATATAFAAGLLVAMGFHEPPAADCGDQRQRVQSYRYAIKAALEHPVLNWLLAQSIVMSAACHLPSALCFWPTLFSCRLENSGV